MIAGAANTRYPIPLTSMTSESAVIAPTTPSTDAITSSLRRVALGGDGLGLLAGDGLAHRALVVRAATRDGRHGRAVHDGRRGCHDPGRLGVRRPDRDREG